jgi:hypothetical protein
MINVQLAIFMDVVVKSLSAFRFERLRTACLPLLDSEAIAKHPQSVLHEGPKQQQQQTMTSESRVLGGDRE